MLHKNHIISLLLCLFAGWSSAFATFDSNKTYTIKNVGAGLYLSLQTGHTETSEVNATPLVSTPVAFQITESNSKVRFKSNNLYLALSNNATYSGWNTRANTTTASTLVWTIEEASTPNHYYIHCTKGYLKYDGNHKYAYTDGKNKETNTEWEITPSVTYATALEDGKYYRFQNQYQRERFLTAFSGSLYAYEQTDIAYDQVWQAQKSGSNWTLRNLFTDTYAAGTKDSNGAYKVTSSAATLVITSPGTVGNDTTYFMMAPSGAPTQFYNNSKSAQQYRVVAWNAADDQSSWWFAQNFDVTDDDLARIEVLRAEQAEKESILSHVTTYKAALKNFFADNACTELLPQYASMTDDDLRTAIGETLPPVLREMAVNVKNDKWDADATKSRYVKGFRIADYDIYSDPDKWQAVTNTGKFAILTNPTGITVHKGDLLYIMVQNAKKDAYCTLQLGIAEDTNKSPSQTVTISAGLNIIQSNYEGEAFVIYKLNNINKYYTDYPAITIHIEGGEASGMWDLHRGMTNDDWNWLSANLFTNRFLHVKGESTVLNVLTENVRGAENVEGIIKIWDFIFETQQRLIGHDGQWNGRYRPVINPHHSYKGNPNWGGGYGTNHPNISRDYLFNFEKMCTDVGHLWEIYHEIGHAHQYPINMAATTESSNNGYAHMTNYEFGSYNSRNKGIETLITFKNNGWGWVDILRGGEGTSRSNNFQYYDDALWVQSHLFFQLYLYFHVQGHMTDFWPRVADAMRSNGGIVLHGNNPNNPTLYYEDYLKFAKVCAEVSKTDLYEFFDTWGFFAYYDDIKVGNEYEGFSSKDNAAQGIRFVGDYGTYYLKMPVKGNEADEKRLADLRDFMHSQPHKAPGIMFIDDHITDMQVADTAFVVSLKPELRGTTQKYYGVTRGTSGKYGMFTDFDGVNHGKDLNYSISGSNVSLAGSGIVGIKVYDENGRIIRIFNKSFYALDSDVIAKLKDGTYTLAVVFGDDTQMPFVKGDITDLNGDGEVTVDDLALLIHFLPHTAYYNRNQVEPLSRKVLQK